jgi:hypothetical protein
MKHLKLTLNPLNSTTLQPMSKDMVNQVILYFIRNLDNDCCK